MTKVEDITGPLEVGKTYLVPCLYVSYAKARGAHWMPFVPFVHEDKELSNPNLHVHYDYRFIDEKMRSILVDVNGTHTVPVVNTTANPEFSYREMVCIRPLNQTDPCGLVGSTLFIESLDDYCRDRKFLGKVCPHKGYPLEGMPSDETGAVTCPLHGSRWAKDGSYQSIRLPAEILVVHFLQSGMPIKNPRMRLFQNDISPKVGITLDDIVECAHYTPVDMDGMSCGINPPRIITEKKVVTFETTDTVFVTGYYITVDGWDRPLWIDRFRKGCSFHEYKVGKGDIFNVTLHLER